LIDPGKTCLFIPPELKKFKLELFERIGQKIEEKGGRVVRGDISAIASLPHEIIPIVGCTPALRPLIDEWQRTKRNWIYWDRGYARRVFATWLPKGDEIGIKGGYYRWHLNSYQMQTIRDVPSDRWDSLKVKLENWRTGGKHIVIASPSATYEKFHGIQGWTDRTIRAISLLTYHSKRQIVVRDKETKRPLRDDLHGAYCLITHGSNTAVEAVIMGCHVIVDKCSAAALISKTSLDELEKPPLLPDRKKWANALAYSQFNEKELVDGTLWRLIT